MKIRTRGAQAFNVPNTEEGNLFLQLLRKFRNRGWHYRARGRGPRKEHGNQYSVPQEHAEWLAVYLEQKSKWHDGQWVNPAQPAMAFYHNVNLADFGQPEPEPVAVNNGGGIYIASVAEWSSPFIQGSPVAVDGGGTVYNSAPHGLQPGTQNIGFAIGESQGLIGEGEGVVHVQLNPWVSHVDLNPPAAPKADNEVVLTPDEQGMLEKILDNLADNEVGHWDPEDRDVFDALYDKLVD